MVTTCLNPLKTLNFFVTIFVTSGHKKWSKKYSKNALVTKFLSDSKAYSDFVTSCDQQFSKWSQRYTLQSLGYSDL